MHIDYRPAQPADYPATEQLTREAFWNCYAPGCCEHYLLHVLRGHPDHIAALDLVARVDGELVGHCACMLARIECDRGHSRHVLTLGPLSVHPAWQGRGIGRGLIEHTCIRARELGYPAIVLCGDPLYYARTGFVAAEQLGIRTADNHYLDALQVYELIPDALRNDAGRYCESPAYSIDPEAAEEYDRSFPPKERLTDTPSQRRFEELVARCREA